MDKSLVNTLKIVYALSRTCECSRVTIMLLETRLDQLVVLVKLSTGLNSSLVIPLYPDWFKNWIGAHLHDLWQVIRLLAPLLTSEQKC